jgi:hypothetical protein
MGFMLLSWDHLILEHLIRGDLPKEEKTDADLELKLTKLRESEGARTPSIYIHYFVNAEGDSPTPRTFKNTFSKAKLYLRGLGSDDDDESADVADEIDKVVKQGKRKNWETAENGYRRYIEGVTQAQKCLDLIKAAEKRCKDLPLDTPL